MKTIIEVICYVDDKVIHEVDVTGKSERSIDRVESGMQVNLNHTEYYTQVTTKP